MDSFQTTETLQPENRKQLKQKHKTAATENLGIPTNPSKPIKKSTNEEQNRNPTWSAELSPGKTMNPTK